MWSLIACMGWLSITLLTGFVGREDPSSAAHRLEQLWQASSSLKTNTMKWTVKINGEIASPNHKQQFLDQVSTMKKMFHMPDMTVTTAHGKFTATSNWNDQGNTIHWMAVQRDGDRMYWVVQFESSTNEVTPVEQAYANLRNVQGKIEKALHAADMTYQWNGTVQGEAARNGEDLVEATVKRVEGQMAKQAKLTVKETYADVSTYSASYAAPMLGKGIISGNQEINMQIAAHRISGTNKERVSIGLPLITIEY
jgi:hypothetical protein